MLGPGPILIWEQDLEVDRACARRLLDLNMAPIEAKGGFIRLHHSLWPGDLNQYTYCIARRPSTRLNSLYRVDTGFHFFNTLSRRHPVLTFFWSTLASALACCALSFCPLEYSTLCPSLSSLDSLTSAFEFLFGGIASIALLIRPALSPKSFSSSLP